MSWNYRIVEYADGSGYGLHEVFYDDRGIEESMTANAVGFRAETPEELRSDLMRAKVDAEKRPVFVEPKDWQAYKTAKGVLEGVNT